MKTFIILLGYDACGYYSYLGDWLATIQADSEKEALEKFKLVDSYEALKEDGLEEDIYIYEVVIN